MLPWKRGGRPSVQLQARAREAERMRNTNKEYTAVDDPNVRYRDASLLSGQSHFLKNVAATHVNGTFITSGNGIHAVHSFI